MKLFLALCFTLGSVCLVSAQTKKFTDDYIGCISEKAHKQMGVAIANGDKRLAKSMIGKTCVLVKGYEFSILDRGILTTSVRVYVGSRTIDLIVPSEAVR